MSSNEEEWLKELFGDDLDDYMGIGRRDVHKTKAASTLANMKRDWAKFVEFAETKQVTPLPADPRLVYAFCMFLATRSPYYYDEDGELTYDQIDISIEEGYELKAGTLNRYLGAIRHFHEAEGFEDPALHPHIVRFRKGWAQQDIDKPTRQAMPINDDVLGEMLDGLHVRLSPIRDKAAAHLKRAGVGPKPMSRLRWEDIHRLQAGEPITLECTGFSPQGKSIVEIDPDATEHLLAWRTILRQRKLFDLDNPVFPHISRAGVLSPESSISAAAIRQAVQRWESADSHEEELSLTDIRDAFLLVLNRATGFRASETLRLRWGDITETKDDGLRITARKTKTGSGRTAAALPLQDPRLDVVSNMSDWRTAWADIVGREPSDKDPLVIPVTGSHLVWTRRVFIEDAEGNSGVDDQRYDGPEPEGDDWELQPLSYNSYNKIVKRRGARVGYDADTLSSHSYRVGLAWQALKDGADARQAGYALGHKSTRSVQRYAEQAYEPTAEGSPEQLRQKRLNAKTEKEAKDHSSEESSS